MLTSVRTPNSSAFAFEGPSSASSTEMRYATGFPGVKKSPSFGSSNFTTGAVLPTRIGTLAVDVAPPESVTKTFAT